MELDFRHISSGDLPTGSEPVPRLRRTFVPVGVCATSAALTSLAWALLGSDNVTRKAGLTAIVLSAFAATAVVCGVVRAQALGIRAEVHAIQDQLADQLTTVDVHHSQQKPHRRRRGRGGKPASRVRSGGALPAGAVPADLEAFLQGWQSPDLNTDR